MIHKSASFAFLKKSKVVRVEVSGLHEQRKSINRPTYIILRKLARKQELKDAHLKLIYTTTQRDTLRVIPRRLLEPRI